MVKYSLLAVQKYGILAVTQKAVQRKGFINFIRKRVLKEWDGKV
jgi:hypothetical protein